jgi:hypothetical protein
MRAAGELVTTNAITLRRCFGLAIVFALVVGCGPQSGAPKTFVVPEPSDPPVIRKVLPNASWVHPAPEAEIPRVFDLFYKARTLPRGGQFDVEALRGLVAGAYADYTLPLFDREVADAKAGVLQQVSFSGISVSIVEWYRGKPGVFACPEPCSPPPVNPTPWFAHAQVTRTRTEVRAGGPPTQQTATYKFGLRRDISGDDGVIWVVNDFLNPASGGWVSEPPPITELQVAADLKIFFADFYARRSLGPGHPMDLKQSERLVGESYKAYTMPLLERTQAEAASGTLTEVRYADLSVRLLSWDPGATQHGGLALAEVTRTSFVTRPSGPEPPRTATYRFRVHRHADLGGSSRADQVEIGSSWLAVDFLRPDVNRWVSDLAGVTVLLQGAGHA